MPALLFAIVGGYFAMFLGLVMRFIKDDKDGIRDGFDDREVK